MPAEERRLPYWVWIVYAAILAGCVPWYVKAVDPAFGGFPLWGAVVMGFAVLLAVFTAYVYLKVWPDEEGEIEGPAESEGQRP